MKLVMKVCCNYLTDKGKFVWGNFVWKSNIYRQDNLYWIVKLESLKRLQLKRLKWTYFL